MKSICTSIEEKMLTVLRGLDLPIDIEGLFEVARVGVVKEQDLTALQVRVFNARQVTEAHDSFTVDIEIRLNVEQAESANGALFFASYEPVALVIERLMVADACTELDTDEVFVDGLQLAGGDANFESSNGEWFAVWNMTLTGRLK